MKEPENTLSSSDNDQSYLDVDIESVSEGILKLKNQKKYKLTQKD